ncbi:InlB B-repeat-containing protein [Evtepia sp.]|uniref:InlB B-repeat-containing protein n=1 Tax=Evtepia sp. TaxID=2773933 RepID=UPI00399BA77B
MMRKKIVSLCMALALCLSLLPATALAAGEHDSHSNGWTELTANTTTLSGGSYYLSGDVEYSGTESITVSGEVILCLNDHKLDLKGQHISVGSGASLTLCDCSTGGVLTGGSDSARNGGGVYVAGGGTFTLTGGNITGNTAAAGGGVYVDEGGTFTMAGGSINNNKATSGGGGGVMVNLGTFTLSGGSITGNATNDETYGSGGGVCLYGTFYLSGDSIIQNNTKAGATDNLYLGWNTIKITGPLGENARIGVNAEGVPRSFISGWSDNMAGEDPADYFSSDGDAWDIGLNANGDVVLGSLCTIVTQPADKSVIEGKTATFTVNATGSEPLSYQWQQNMNGSGWTDITGETNATYTTEKTTMDMNGTQYRCVVSNSAGSVISDAATLTVQKSTTPIDPKYVRYIVEHYKQNADGSYTLADTEQPIDEIGKTVTATPKTYEGYTYNPNAAGTVVSGTLKAISSPDDIVTLKLYYDITLYTVTVNGSYAQTTGAGNYAEGATVAIDAGTRSGYTFDGWTSADGVTFANAGSAQTTFTMPAGDVTVTAGFTRISSGPTTYAITAPDAENGTVRVSPSRASRGTTVTITVTPDEGYELESLTVLDSRDNEISLTDKGDGKYTFTMPAGRVTVEASFAKIAPEPLPFGDVDDGDWFADAVRFVYANGMMNGVSETDFAPHAATSRSMIVTILYRMEGEPVVDYAMDFTDVASDAYYTEAVRWAASKGIVGGYGNGLFGANDDVTREQLAAILYRYAACQGYDVSQRADLSGFGDASSISGYAQEALSWAHAQGLVLGFEDGSLRPQGTASRAQIAAVLMRFLAAVPMA